MSKLNIDDMLCMECGSRGFKSILNSTPHVTKEGKHIMIENIPALQCSNCMAIVYPHEGMLYLQEQTKQ